MPYEDFVSPLDLLFLSCAPCYLTLSIVDGDDFEKTKIQFDVFAQTRRTSKFKKSRLVTLTFEISHRKQYLGSFVGGPYTLFFHNFGSVAI